MNHRDLIWQALQLGLDSLKTDCKISGDEYKKVVSFETGVEVTIITIVRAA